MLTSNPLILELLSLLRQHGVRDMVLCPGSRNAGIVHSVCQIPEFRTHTATDERSAGFMAIGMADATDKPVAVVVTSGSALANLYPSACEAYYRQVPVVFISADRPEAWIGQMDGQTMPQAGALGQMVKMRASLPENNLWHANRLLNEAMLACTTRQPRGPVHINIPVSEPIYEFTTESLPQARVIRLTHSFRDMELCPGRTLIICGQMSPAQVADTELWTNVAKHFTIIAENLSNLPPNLYTHPTRIDWSRMKPVDRVITVGGHIINKELKQFFRTHRPQEHWHVSEDGAVADLFCCQTLAVKATVNEFLQGMAEHWLNERMKNKQMKNAVRMENPNSWTSQAAEPMTWTSQAAEPITFILHSSLSQSARLLEKFFSLLPENSAVHLANSSTVRLAQEAMDRWFRSTPEASAPTILCNRGINGIEGSLSTAVGYALACPEKPTYIITGDLAFFYDRNGLWITPIPRNLHILLLNDGGGNIFNTLPLPQEATSRKAIMGTHTLTARNTAEQHGLLYLQGEEQLETFVNAKETTLLEINYRMKNSSLI